MEHAADTDRIVYQPDPDFVESTNIATFMREYDIADYEELIERTCGDIDWFWDVIPTYLDIEFYEPYSAVRDDSNGPQFTEWYPGGRINIAHNVLDRHGTPSAPNRNRVACIWEGEPGDVREVTYYDLLRQANRVANALTERGIAQGDTVALYMPMVPEVVSILYGCFKVGAIAVPIFSGFGDEAVATRLDDADATVLFTADGFYRRGSEIRLLDTASRALDAVGTVEHTIVYRRLEPGGSLSDPGFTTWTDAVESCSAEFETVELPAHAESMLLYSSGTTGMPKGIVHTHAGVLVQCAKELFFGFDVKPQDRFFWVSDIGWMMGPWMLIGNHTFGGTIFMYEGAPDHPSPDRFWAMIDRHGLTQFGISPTAVRALRQYGDAWLTDHDLTTLRILGSTGEPWDPESWLWFHDKIGGGRCPIINISGGTEICGCFLMPMPIQPLKPCTLGGPGLGMDIDIVDETGQSILDSNDRGYLVARDSCPSMTKSLWSGDERYLEEYWSTWDDLWDHGDWAQRDEDGFWFLHGRADDALNVAGRKVGPAEVEGVLIDHPAVNQAAAVGVPDETSGTAVVAYVILEPDAEPSDALRDELRNLIGRDLGKPFRPREILFVNAFPKTQSGKIIRRAVQAAYTGADIGDLSSLENPDALEAIRNAI